MDLAPGRDLLASLRPLKRGQVVVAFAAETSDLETRGRRKMEAKGADLIVVNDVGRPGIGFDAEENEVLLLARDGGRQTVGRAPKREIADRIWDAFRAVRDQASRFSASTIHLSDSQPK
jgi:phosphopantothenoylcysteine decarboxylase/phosphopantothenate--cysteine ligase